MTARIRSRVLLCLIGPILFIGCAPSEAPPDPDDAHLPAIETRTVELPVANVGDGSSITLELAMTSDELATGLMYRPSLAADRGMLLLFGVQRYPSIWMKNTLLDLDLIFLDESGTVVDIVPAVPPCATDPCPTYAPSAPARAVLEMAAGGADLFGITVGDQLTFERVPGYPVVELEAADGTDSDVAEQS